MKSFILLICLLVSGLASFAQTDSVKVSVAKPEFDFMYQELFNFSPSSTFGALKFEKEPPLLSKQFGFSKDFFINYNPFSLSKTLTFSNQFPVFSPFINSLSITSEGDYRLNDKFTLGGNSFTGNSIFNPLPLNPSMQDMNIHGATMFLQYKISNKFKVSGGVTISNHDGPFIP